MSQRKDNENKQGIDFQQVFRRYYRSLVMYTDRYLADIEESASIVQDVFLMIWEKRYGFSDEAAVRQYIYTSARNRALNVLRSNDTGRNYLKKSTGPVTHADHQEFYIEEETFRILFQEIDKLPREQRQVILYSLDHKNINEIAGLMGISVNTVKFHKKNAYKTLRQRISSQYFLLLMLLLHR